MAQTVPPIFNSQLFHTAQPGTAPKDVVIPYTCEPDAVGIAIREGSPDTYLVYCTNEHGALDWEQSYRDFAQALNFAQEFYVHYQKFLYGSDVFERKSSKAVTRLNLPFAAPSDLNASQYQIVGKNKLQGEIFIGGSVHAGLAILSATLLVNGPCRIENLPAALDIQLLLNILAQMGADVQPINETAVKIDCSAVGTFSVRSETASRFWGSCYLIGALLGRFGESEIPVSRDSVFYSRPLKPHIRGLAALGAAVRVYRGLICTHVSGSRGLTGASITLDVPSEDVTVNLMLAATLARGTTEIQNAAKDPNIVDLANFLNFMGADITGAGTNVIKIRGVERLTGGSYAMIPDRIEAGTYMAAVAAAGGSAVIRNVIPTHLKSISRKLQEMGVRITDLSDAVLIESKERLRSIRVRTAPYPGFPTDMQPQIAACMAAAEGSSVITDGVVETGFPYMEELRRFGVSAEVDGKYGVIEGAQTLCGAPVRALDPYSGAAMVIAGLAAEGTTVIRDVYHIRREYGSMVEKLTKVGANIRAVNDTNDLKQRVPKIG